jgi:ATP-dependent DNA helicase PIF1
MTNIPQEKLEILDKIEKKKNVFVTGSAGTGKSYLLTMVRQSYLRHNMHLTASTGIAAVQIGGVTLHSWAGLGTGSAPFAEVMRFINSGKGTHIRRKLKKTRILAIDEISMLSADIFDLLNNVLKEVRGNPDPFGGIQLVLFGDFLQLPPVIGYGMDRNARKFCFESEAWEEANIETYNLKQVFRQEDKFFVDLLNGLRTGNLSEEHIEALNKRRQNCNDNLVKPTILATHNRQVELINKQKLDELSGECKIFSQVATGNPNQLAFLQKNCLAPESLSLKVGAQVMMLKNTYQKDGITNGSIGIVKEFTKTGLPVVLFTNGKTITIEPEEWLIEEFDHDKQEMITKARLTQIPLMLAWAITVHKSQGMTLDKIECNLGSAFEEGQIYVALSRVKSLDGLYLTSFNERLIKANPKVIEFYKKMS